VDAARAHSLRLEMLADTPLAYLETPAQAAARTRAEYVARACNAAEGDERAQFIADDGILIGQAVGIAAAREPDTTIVVAVYVTPAHRGTGILGQLIDAVAVWSRAAGRPRLILEVVEGNARAIAAYRKLGFIDTGVRSPHPTIPGLRELVMARTA
jgi:GNAT superfamily N-acetyltransferase